MFRMTTHGAILYAVMVSNANIAIKPSAEQAHLLCRGGARSRNSSIPSLAMRHQPSFRGSIATVGISSLTMHYQRGLSLVGFEEILHSIQNDNTWRDTIRCHAERSRSIPSLTMHYQRGLSLVGFEEILH